ncbi:MAG TPA: hypothetical protein VK146_11395 [Tabrizicola sp.]|nr:hypothetical protein [Tabrizicola sp.]
MKLPDEYVPQVRDIKQSVRMGSLAAGQTLDPFQNTGGRGSSRLPPAPAGQSYYSYRLGKARPPAGGFVPGAEQQEGGSFRLVLLISQSTKLSIQRVCHVPDPPNNAAAVPLAFSADYPSLLRLKSNPVAGSSVNPTLPVNHYALARQALTVPGQPLPQDIRTVRHKFDQKVYPRSSFLNQGSLDRDIYFTCSTSTSYMIHKSYFTSDHYQEFFQADYI